MPMPKPQDGESRDDFMSRCMGDDAMNEDFPENDQRAAVCMQQWNEGKSISTLASTIRVEIIPELVKAIKNNRELTYSLATKTQTYRAYSVLNIKSVDSEKRILEGIASTPAPDRMNDVVELDGIHFKLPLPFLYQHDPKQPIGTILSATKRKDGLHIKVQMAAAGVAGFIDEAWSLIKAGLVRGLSIGFRSLEEAFNKETGGFRFLETELFEVSAVTIPANAEATILTVKSADAQARAVSGRERVSVVRLANTNSPSVLGLTGMRKSMAKKTIAEQILEFQTKRNANAGVMQELMDKAAEEGRDLLDEESTQYDDLKAENGRIDKHVERLKEHEANIVAKATPVVNGGANPQQQGEQVRRGEPIQVRSNLPKGTLFTRYVGAMATCNGNAFEAAEYAKQLWGNSTPEVVEIIRNARHMKSAVEAGDTTTSGWASQLIPAAQQMQGEFLELLRPATIIGRIPGLRNVPTNIAVPVQTGGGTYSWVGEGRRKPVTSMLFDSVTLRWAKAAGIVVITQELAKFSTPSAEEVVRNQMIKGCAAFLDAQFVDPTVAAVSNVSPASITNGIADTPATGTTAAAFRTNMQTAMGLMVTNNQDPSQIVILMSATVALNLSLLQNALGQPEFPGISVSGGSILGLPVIVSQAVGARIILLIPDQILVAPDGGITVDMSREATIEMDTEPVQGESSPITASGSQRNMFQDNMLALRVERWITWVRGRTSAVEYISNAVYSG